jgi:tRNA(Ile)-lysidine synthase
MIKHIRNTIEKYSMLDEGDSLLLCVSGGVDSIAMLYAFCVIAKDMKIRLFLAHMNHSLRGDSSDKDQLYVENAAKQFRLPIMTEKVDTKEFSRKHKISIEDAARRLRYNFFINTAQKLGIGTVATAHTKDDQAETVLMRMIRGTGLRGLRGIPAKNYISDIKIIRPFIGVSRAQVTAYLSSKGCKPRFDRSNTDIRFLRNKIRRRLIPMLEHDYNPEIKDTLSSFAEIAARDYDYLCANHSMVFKKLAGTQRAGIVRFSLSDIRKQHISIQRGIIRNAIEFLRKNLDNIDYRHWREIESLIDSRPAGSRVDLPNNIAVNKTKTSIVFGLSKKTVSKKPQSVSFISRIPSATHFSRYIIKARPVKRVPGFACKPENTEYLDIKDTDFPLVLRTHKDGDRIRPLGMKKHKKLSDIFIDEKIPVKKRKKIPLVVSSGGEIACIFNVKISDSYKINPDTERIVKLELLTR